MKVYYFCYEQTIQEDALQLVAAKMAASLRVNGDTVGDDSLAELDELASGDLLATLAKIVVGLRPNGETQIEARSLQQAFAEANAGLRRANTIIDDYQLVEEEQPQPVRQPNGAGPRTRLIPAGDSPPANGAAHQMSLFAGDPAKLQREPAGNRNY